MCKARPGCTTEVPLQLPAAPINVPPITISILLKNNSGVSNEWEIKRLKNCDCQLVEVNRYMTFRCKEYECPHRPLLKIFPLTGKLKVINAIIFTF